MNNLPHVPVILRDQILVFLEWIIKVYFLPKKIKIHATTIFLLILSFGVLPQSKRLPFIDLSLDSKINICSISSTGELKTRSLTLLNIFSKIKTLLNIYLLKIQGESIILETYASKSRIPHLNFKGST